MLDNGRKTIGVFVSQVNSEFQEIVSKGIQTRAKDLNYNVVFFTNFGGYGQPRYDAGEIQIADVPYYEDFDGVILVPDTLAIEGLESRIREHIQNRCKCPVVSIRRMIESYYNVLIDDETVIEELIRHLIRDHGYTRLNFLAGPKDFPDSEKRLASYKKVLSEFQIPIEEERIYYGDFWKNAAGPAIDRWLSSALERPQAIVCANDYMAIAASNALAAKGVSVPEEIAITGCDDIIDAAEYSPAITTAKMPAFDMGTEAVEKIHKHICGIDQPMNSYIKTTPVFRESCGCKYNQQEMNKERKRYYINMTDSLQRAVARNAYMSGDLTGLTKLDEINARLMYYIYENVGFSDFYMCLHPNWQNYRDENTKEAADDDDYMIMEAGNKNREGYYKIRFPKRELIPKQFMDDEPTTYFISMLHHHGIIFGYAAIRFRSIQVYMQTFQAWLINVSNALENVRVHSELNRLVYKLEDMYIRDDLTGLYNRRGLETLGKKYLRQAVEERVKLMVFTADMDKLKMINDNYGHISGDIAIKVVADALQKAADDDEICIRCGGDEFTVIGLEYDEKKMNHFVKKFVEELDKFNQSGNYEFNVYVSYGWSLVTPDENTTVEDCMIVADSRMYQQKYEKESLRLRANLVR